MKRQHVDEELAEDDGMAELRCHIHKVNQTCGSHEERGAALRALMIAIPKKAALIGGSASSSSQAQTNLPGPVVVAPQLEALPVELVENIACHLVLGDFGRLRLTCAALRHKSSHAFIKRFFTKRTLRLDWLSLRRLVLILADTHISASIKDLLILVGEEGEFCKPSNYPRLPVYSRRSRSGSSGNSSGYSPHSYNDNQIRQHEMMLDRIFGRLPVLRSLSLSEEQPANGLRNRPRLGMSILALSLVFAAVASNGTKVQSLALGGQHGNGAYGFVYANIRHLSGYRPLNAVLIKESTGLIRAFEHLNCVDLAWSPTLQSHMLPISTVDQQIASGEFPNSLLKLTPNIERLVLRDPSKWVLDPDLTDAGISYLDPFVIPLPKLRTLELFIPTFLSSGKPLYAIRMFKEKCGRVLDEVRLHGLTLVRATLVEGVVQKMKDELGIGTVTFEMAETASGSEDEMEEDET